MRKTIIYIAFLLYAFAAVAQINVSAGLDSNTITIGDQVNLTISVSNADNAVLYFPTSDNFAQEGIELIQQVYDTTFDKSGLPVAFNQISTITSFDAGIDTIADLKVRCLMPDNSLIEMALDTIFLTVNDVAVDTTKAIKDIAGVLSVPYTFSDFFPWILLVVLVLGVAVLIYYIYKRVKNKKPILPVAKPVVVSPEEKALHELESLRVAGMWKKGLIKEYHTTLTDILRAYIESKMGIAAIEMTTDQILDSYSELRNMPEGSSEKLLQILSTADMVKFAKSEPLPNEHDRSLNYAVNFVQQTADTINQQRRVEEERKENNEPKTNNE